VRVACLAVAALIAVPALSACNTSPGAAAVVGDKTITTGDLQSEVNAALADKNVQATVYPTGTAASARTTARAGFVRQTLARLVGDQLVLDLAAVHHVTVTPQEVADEQASFVQQTGSLASLQQQAAQAVGVGASGLGPLIRITVMQQKLGDALAAQQPATQAQLEAEYNKDIDSYDQLQVAQIAVTKQALANRLLRQVRANPSKFASLASHYSIDTTSKANGGLVGFVPRSQVVGVLPSGASGKPGTYAVIHSGAQYVVLHIIKRQVQPLSQVVDKVKASLYGAQSQQLLGKALQTEATKLGIHINPRYGRWDNTTQSVVAT
jgi:parvulin-like peptidyl-prolyl isomerase